MNLTLLQIAKACDGRLYGNPVRSITKITTDSREFDSPFTLFAAIRGEKTDGHVYTKAISAQDGAVLIDNPNYICESCILVDNVKAAIGKIASFYRVNYLQNIFVAAVTGSAGKTTTKEMTAAAFSQKRTYKSEGNKNSLLGLPLSVLEIPEDSEVAVLEAGMSEPGEIAALSYIAKPSMAIITCIGSSHIQSFGSVEAICREKLTLCAGMEEGSPLILNADDKMLSVQKTSMKQIYFGSSESSDFRFEKVSENENTSVISVLNKFDQKKYEIEISVSGEHNMRNAAAAFAAAVTYGCDPEQAAKDISLFKVQGNRQRIFKKGEITIIADCYNASPESMQAALKVLSSYPGRKIAILGDMLELGDFSEKLHIEAGRQAAALGATEAVFIGDFAQAYAKGFGRGVCFSASNREKATEYIKNMLRDYDTVLFKASNRMNFSDLIKKIFPDE